MFQPASKRAKLHFVSHFLRRARFSIFIAGIFTTIASVSPVAAQVAVRIPDSDLQVYDIQNIEGQVWLGTGQGLYRVDGDTPKPIGDRNLEVNNIQNINGQVWVGTMWGLYRIDGNTPKLISDSDIRVYNIQNINERVWLGTDKGLYRVDNNTPKLIGNSNLRVNDFQNINGKIWVGTNQGLYRVEGDTLKHIDERNLEGVNHIRNIKGQVWLETNNGLYRVDGDTPKPIIPGNPDLKVIDIQNIKGQVWLETNKGSYPIGGDTSKPPIGDLNFWHTHTVTDIQNINGRIWLGTYKGLYRADGNILKPIGNPDLAVTDIQDVKGQVWLRTYKGLYRVDGDIPKLIGDRNLRVYDIQDVNGQVWLKTYNGAYRFNENVTIAVDLDSKGLWWQFINKISPWKVWVSPLTPKPCYTRIDKKITSKHNPDSPRCGNDPYDKSFPREFELIMETDKNEFDKALKENDYNPKPREQNISNGWQTVYISVRDQWGNTFQLAPIRIFVAGSEFIAILVAGFWLLLLVVVILLAPYSKFCHYLLMNPYVRNYGSFGLVPILLTVVPPVRRHIFRRYLNEICSDANFAEWQQRFVVPATEFLPESFGKNLEKRRLLFLLGQSGIGKTSYFRYLTISYATQQKIELPPKNVVPIFLPLARYQEEEPENIFHAQLSNYGRLTDKELNKWFLQQGGFLILIDGLNEVNETTRHKINKFVDQYWKANYLCLSSQESHTEFNWIEKVGLSPLDFSKIKALLDRRLEPDQAAAVINQLNEETYKIYQIPQNLEFAIEIIKQNQPLPQTERELYEATLKPILNLWCQNGRTDYPDILFERAYKMFKSRNTFFDRQDEPVPDELQDDLETKKFLIQRGEHYYFRHDLIRAYLAAKYFVSCWQTLLNDSEITVDANWRSLLEFTILDLETTQPTQVKDLLFNVLQKNEKVAGEVFKWLQQSHAHLCTSWTDDFTHNFGAAKLAQV